MPVHLCVWDTLEQTAATAEARGEKLICVADLGGGKLALITQRVGWPDGARETRG